MIDNTYSTQDFRLSGLGPVLPLSPDLLLEEQGGRFLRI